MPPPLNAALRKVLYFWVRTFLISAIALIFFLRGNIFESTTLIPSVSILIPVVVIALAAAAFSYIRLCGGPVLVRVSPIYVLLLAVILINIFSNVIFYPQHFALSMRFLLEISLNFLIFYLFYLILTRVLDLRRLYLYIAATSLLMIIPVSVIAYNLSSVRRIGAHDTGATLPIAVNHLGHSFAISCIISGYAVLVNKDRRNHRKVALWSIMFLVALVSTVLTGSKAAVLSVGAFFFLEALVRFRRHAAMIFVGTGSALIVALLTVIMSVDEPGKYTNLIDRFTWEAMLRGVSQRMDSFALALEGVRAKDLLLGVPWRYEPINDVQPVSYPHNIVLSFLIHTGLVPALLFLYLICARVYLLFVAIFTSTLSRFGTTTLSIFVAALTYSFTSGRLTRIMTIFVILAIVEYTIRLVRRSRFDGSIPSSDLLGA